MSYQFAISDIGLRLIKAYEGFRPDGVDTREGQRIVGYGQLTDDPELNVNERDAEANLKSELTSIENLINTHIHGAMTQSQFDALCSLAHSIGPEAFLQSETLHALNRGEVISAANGFDSWRLSDIGGEIYIVDALVRRRTAEKALFLRPSLRTIPARHNQIKPLRDDTKVQEKISQSAKAATSNIVTLYDTVSEEMDPTRVEVKTEDEGVFDLDTPITDSTAPDTSETLTDESFTSPIAEAAAEVSERLDALMDTETKPDTENWPDSLIQIDSDKNHETQFDGKQTEDIVIDFLDQDDALREQISNSELNSSERYIKPAELSAEQNFWAYVTMIVFGLTATGVGLWASLKGTYLGLGEMGPLLSSVAVALGVLLLLMGLYYLMKHIFGKS